MGIIRVEVTLSNPARSALAPVSARALVDSGAIHLCLPEHLAIQLDLKELEKREVTLANGHRVAVPYVGPVEVRFRNRRCFTGAMVMGDEPLLGAIPLEDMDLVIVPGRQTIDFNPRNPRIAGSLAKAETVLAPEARSVTEVRQLVQRALAGLKVRVFLFGSRARGDAHVTSDIDVAVLPEEPLPAGLLAEMREALEESPIPQTVDVVDLSEADPEFRARILSEGFEWRV